MGHFPWDSHGNPIPMDKPVPCPGTQQASLLACSPQPPLNAERQAGKLWIPFFKVFCYDSTWEMNPGLPTAK